MEAEPQFHHPTYAIRFRFRLRLGWKIVLFLPYSLSIHKKNSTILV